MFVVYSVNFINSVETFNVVSAQSFTMILFTYKITMFN